MFENLLHQNVSLQIASDIKNNCLPPAILFSGSLSSGKLTAALETSRILSCKESNKGLWNCSCKNCLRHKSLITSDLLLMGSRDCTPEIAASLFAFEKAVFNNTKYLTAARYLFIRSIRKLTMRFNPILWQGDDKYSKMVSLLSEIQEELETLDFPHELPNEENLKKTCEKLLKLCSKLESGFLYDSIPISNVRNMASWVQLKSPNGSKTVIIENADRMLDSVRNALLKTLEEPPSDTVFILTTSKRNAVMPTILSRVRTYSFSSRTLCEQQEVIERVFHNPQFQGSIDDYLLTYLPVQPEEIKKIAKEFFSAIVCSEIPSVSEIVKKCGDFEPRVSLKIFLNEIGKLKNKLILSAVGTEACFQLFEALKNCWTNVTVFNQGPVASLEILVRDIAKINKSNGNVLRCAVL